MSARHDSNRHLTDLIHAFMRGERSADTRVVYEQMLEVAASIHYADPRAERTATEALAHEAFLRMVNSSTSWQNRKVFFTLFAKAVFSTMIDRRRRKGAQRRGGGRSGLDLDLQAFPSKATDQDLIDLRDALEELQRIRPENAEVLLLLFFSGLGVREVALCQNCSEKTISDRARVGKSWLRRRLQEGYGSDERGLETPSG
jgi:RNA polymerase sigma factor (TIGR02999 family)